MLIFMTLLENEFAAKSTADDAMIESIANGNMDAFHRLYELASDSVYGFALSITKNSHDAEDVLQDTFIIVHKNASGYQPMNKPMAWIFTIARNLALMKLRESGKSDSTENPLSADADALSRIEAAGDRMLMKTLLQTLELEERQIILLHAVSGFRHREIAALLELPVGTVLSKYHRAIKKLRIIAEKEGFSE